MSAKRHHFAMGKIESDFYLDAIYRLMSMEKSTSDDEQKFHDTLKNCRDQVTVNKDFPIAEEQGAEMTNGVDVDMLPCANPFASLPMDREAHSADIPTHAEESLASVHSVPTTTTPATTAHDDMGLGLKELSVTELRDLLGEDILNAVGIGGGNLPISSETLPFLPSAPSKSPGRANRTNAPSGSSAESSPCRPRQQTSDCPLNGGGVVALPPSRKRHHSSADQQPPQPPVTPSRGSEPTLSFTRSDSEPGLDLNLPTTTNNNSNRTTPNSGRPLPADVPISLIDAAFAGSITPLHEDEAASMLDRMSSGVVAAPPNSAGVPDLAGSCSLDDEGRRNRVAELDGGPQQTMMLHSVAPSVSLSLTANATTNSNPSSSVNNPVANPTPLAVPGTHVVLSGKSLPTLSINPANGQSLVNSSTTPGRQHVSCLNVAMTEIFKAYYPDKHWDEFKTALEAAKITSLPVRVFNSERHTRPDIVDVVPLDHVKLLLARRAAERTVVAAKSQVETATSAPSDGKQQRGVKTRHSDQPNISFFEIAGEKIPCIVIRERKFVRLVDVERRLLQNGGTSGIVTNARLKALRHACAKLGVHADKCTPNEKARMVVYANSYRHNNLHIVRVDDLPRIVAYEQRRRKADGRAELDGEEDDQEESSHASTSDEDRPPKSPPPSPATTHASRAASRLADDRPLGRAGSAASSEGTSGSGSTKKERKRKRVDKTEEVPVPPRKAGRGRPSKTNKQSSAEPVTPAIPREDLKLSEDESDSDGVKIQPPPAPRLKSKAAAAKQEAREAGANPEWLTHAVRFGVSAAEDLFLAGEVCVGGPKVDAELLDTLKPCEVVLERSAPLPVIVVNSKQERGPLGKYFNHLFVDRKSQCILCCQCKHMFDPLDFAVHSHSSLKQTVQNGKLSMFVHNLANARFDLWERFNEKLQRFGMKNVAPMLLPRDLSDYYQGRIDQARFGRREAQTLAERAKSLETGRSCCWPPRDRIGVVVNHNPPQGSSQQSSPEPSRHPATAIATASSGREELVRTTQQRGGSLARITSRPESLPRWTRIRNGNAAEAALIRIQDTRTVEDFTRALRRVPLGLRDQAKESLFERWYP